MERSLKNLIEIILECDLNLEISSKRKNSIDEDCVFIFIVRRKGLCRTEINFLRKRTACF